MGQMANNNKRFDCQNFKHGRRVSFPRECQHVRQYRFSSCDVEHLHSDTSAELVKDFRSTERKFYQR